MADEQEVVIRDNDGVEHVFPAGFDPTRAASIVRESLKSPKQKDSEDSTTMQTLHEFKGLAEGVPGGILNAVLAVPKLAYTLATTPPDEVGKGLLDSIANLKNIPQEFIDATHEERGKMLGNALGTYAGANRLAKMPRPAARVAGSAIESAGKALGMPLRISGVYKAMQGNPLGVAMAAAPGIVQSGGRALKQWGEAAPEFMEKELQQTSRQVTTPVSRPPIRIMDNKPDVVGRNLESTARPEEQFSGRELKAQKVAQKEAEDTSKAALIEQAKEGMEPSKPSISQRVSAPTPEGGTQSMSIRFKPPEEVDPSGLSPKETKQLERDYPDPELRKKVLAMQAAQRNPAAAVTPTPSRPPIRVTGPMQPPQASTVEPAQAEPAAPREPKVPLPSTIASKSRRTEMSATPGLTVEDAKALGINPAIKITGLTPNAIQQLLEERAARAATYRTNAGLDAGMKRSIDLDTP